MQGGGAGGRRPGRRHFRVLVWFALGLAALNAAVAARARRWRAYDPHPYQELVARCRQQAWDLVVVGGSPAMCGLDPDALAGAPWRGGPLRTAFNLGLPLGTTTDVCLAVEHGLPTLPRLLVYAVTATDLNDARLEPSGPRQLMTAADAARWAADRPADAEWCVRHFLLERAARLWPLQYYRTGIRLWAADRLWPGLCPAAAADARRAAARTAVLRHGRGFFVHAPVGPATRLDAQKAAGLTADTLPFLEGYRVGGGHLAYLSRLLDWADGHGVPVVLVDLPVPADLEERMYPKEFSAYRLALAGVAEARRVPVLCATRAAVGLNDADFSDLIHLNAAGAARLSAWLRAALASRCNELDGSDTGSH
jgi:hypothetical protein